MRYEVELTDEQARSFESGWRGDEELTYGPYGEAALALADAIRANPPKPPRMAEPGWGEKVIASFVQGGLCLPRVAWVRFTDEPLINVQYVTRGGVSARWDDLIDPEPLDGAS